MARIKVREFARRDGCDEKLVRRAIQKGRLKAHTDGTLDEKLVGTGWRKTNRRNGPADTADTAPKTVRTVRDTTGRQKVEREALPPPPPAPDPPPEPDIQTLYDFIDKILRGEFVDQATAEKVKENALALKHLLDGRQKAGELIEIETAKSVLFESYRAARDAWLNWPSKYGPQIAAELGIDAERVVEALTRYVHQQLSDLGEPDAGEFTGSS